MQHKNVWTSKNDETVETQTKLKRTSDYVTEETNESLNLVKEKKSKFTTILDFSRKNTLTSQSKSNFSFKLLITKYFTLCL